MKKIKDTKFGQLLTQFLPPLAKDVENLIPGTHLLSSLVQAVCSNPDITEEQKKQLTDASLELSIELSQLDNDDRANARDMQIVNLNQSSTFSKTLPGLIAMMCLIFSFAYIGVITFMNIPKDNVRFADTILGFLLGVLISTVVNYYFGSSRSSALKDETMKSIVNTNSNITAQ